MVRNVDIPHSVMHANATFNVVFTLDLDSGDRPGKITGIRNEFLADEPPQGDLAQQMLPAKNRRVKVVYRWKHGVGWTIGAKWPRCRAGAC